MNKPYRAITEVDRMIHEPARLAIMAVLYARHEADFKHIWKVTGLTKGNLSCHLSRLEEAGYVDIEKRFLNNRPNTLCRLTSVGIRAFGEYWTEWQRIVEEIPENGKVAEN